MLPGAEDVVYPPREAGGVGVMRGWWRRRSRRTKLIISGAAVILVLGAVAGSPPKPQTSGPTSTPQATATATSAALSPTPGPSATATEEASVQEPTPEPTPAEAFAPIKLIGRGSKVPKFTIPEGAAAIATISETGTSNFAVWTLAADGSQNELLVNELGSYKGTVLFDVDSGEHSVAFKIESNGSWTITIAPLTRARKWDTSQTLTGKGDDVVQLSEAVSGLATTTVTHRGRSNFAVHSYSDSGSDLLVNEIGNYKAEIQLPDGTLLLQIEADGTWSFTAPQ
jgi:hypothetical protein